MAPGWEPQRRSWITTPPTYDPTRGQSVKCEFCTESSSNASRAVSIEMVGQHLQFCSHWHAQLWAERLHRTVMALPR